MAETGVDQTNVYNFNDPQQSLLVTNRNEKYFLGDRKTFMKQLNDKIDQISLDLADPDKDSIIIDGESIEDKSTTGAIFYINTKLNGFKDLNRTIISTFDYLKEIEEEVSRLITT